MTDMKNKSGLNLVVARAGCAIVLLFSLFAFFLILTPILGGQLGRLFSKPEAALRITMVIQDLLVFILPAIITALVSTRLPAKMLAVDVKPKGAQIALALLILICSVPFMNMVISWNESIHLPESMREIETMLRSLEDNAAAVTEMLMAGASVPSLVVSVLIIGVLAGFSEELFFRGALQRLVMMTRVNPHVAIWLVAFIFSLFHFQFFGFVPRMLLGAQFGYLLWWTGSFWIPAIVHMVNNSIVVCSTWYAANHPDAAFNVDSVGTDMTSAISWVAVAISVIVTVVLLMALHRSCHEPVRKG